MTFDHTISIVISPCLNQRVRYEKECEETLRYVSVPQNGTMRIEVNVLFVNILII
jgi:hypothetical protein